MKKTIIVFEPREELMGLIINLLRKAAGNDKTHIIQGRPYFPKEPENYNASMILMRCLNPERRRHWNSWVHMVNKIIRANPSTPIVFMLDRAIQRSSLIVENHLHFRLSELADFKKVRSFLDSLNSKCG